MKKIPVLLIMLLFIVACNNAGTEAAKEEAAEKKGPKEKHAIEVAVISISGMHCDACVTTINNALSGLEGVEGTKVSLEYEQAKVKFDPSKVSTDAFKAAIEDKGYVVDSIQVMEMGDQAAKPEEQPSPQVE